LIGTSLAYGIYSGNYIPIIFAGYAAIQALKNVKPDEPYTAEEECKIIVGRMDLEIAPELA